MAYRYRICYGTIYANHFGGAAWKSTLKTEAPFMFPATEGATCKKVPAGRFAVATVPEGEPVLATWYKFFEPFEKEASTLAGTCIDLEFPFNFESFDENGACQ